jgi:uncharacterized membrane protein YkoI
MKKRYLVIGMITAGILLAGCGARAGGETGGGQAQQSAQAAQSMDDNGIHADAPKGTGNQSSGQAEAQSSSQSAEAQSSSQNAESQSSSQGAGVQSSSQSAEVQSGSQSADAGQNAAAGQNAGGQGTDSLITEAQAREIALADAGKTEADVGEEFIRVKLDRDDGRLVYEVEFYVGMEEFDYDIDAASGTIVGRDYDIEDDFANTSSAVSVPGNVISRDEAVQIILQRVPGASAQNVRIELDEDDGWLIYEGELYYNHVEYEFELNAATGEILEWSEDRD